MSRNIDREDEIKKMEKEETSCEIKRGEKKRTVMRDEWRGEETKGEK